MKYVSFLFFLVGVAAAVGPPPVTLAQIEQAIRELGSEDFPTRERATMLLWGAGQPAEPALRKALESNDAEVVSRARDLLEKIPFGITPETSKKIADIIIRSRKTSIDSWPDLVTEIFEDADGLETARMIADKQSDPARRESFRRGIDKVGWSLASRLVATNRLDLAMEMLGRSAATQSAAPAPDFVILRNYAAMSRLRGTLTKDREKWDKWIGGAPGSDGFLDENTPGGVAAQMVAVYLAKAAGDHQRAATLAQHLPPNPWVEMALFDAGRWADLAKVEMPASRPGAAPDQLHQAAVKMVLMRMAGNEADASKARADFAKVRESRRDGSSAWWAYTAEACDRRPLDALAAAEITSNVRLQLMRGDLLMNLGRPADALAALKKVPAAQLDDQLRLAAAIAAVYVTTGDRVALEAHLAAMPKGPYKSAPEQVAALDVVGRFVSLKLEDAARDQAAGMILGKMAPAEPLAKLFPATPLAAEAWFAYLTRSPGLTTPAEVLRTLPSYLDRRLAEGAEQARLDQAIAWAETRPPNERGRLVRGFAEATRAAGLLDRAVAIAKRATDVQPLETYLMLGDFYAQAGQWNEAAKAYEAAMGKGMLPLPKFLTGVARQKAGDVENGVPMQLTAQLMLMGNEKQPKLTNRDEIARAQFCVQLEKRKSIAPEIQQAAREQRRLVVDLSFPTSREARASLAALCHDNDAFADPQARSAANEQLLLRILLSRTTNEDPVFVVHRLLAAQANALLSKGDVAGAVAKANEAHSTLPTSIDFASEFVPELIKRGHRAEADAYYTKVAELFDRLAKDFPNSEAYRTQRANLAARCGRQS